VSKQTGKKRAQDSLQNSDEEEEEEAEDEEESEEDVDNMDASKIKIRAERRNDFEEANVSKILGWKRHKYKGKT